MLVSLMGSSILGEVDDTSIPRTGLSNGYWDPVDRLPASRLLLPRSGLERSDFVLWPFATYCTATRPRSRTGHSGLDLLTLSFSHFDPEPTWAVILL